MAASSLPAVVVPTVPDAAGADREGPDAPWPLSPPAPAPGAGAVEPAEGEPADTTSPLSEQATGSSRSASVVLTGVIVPDRMVGGVAANYARSPGSYDFGPFFAAVADEVTAADLALCHLDGSIGPGLPPAGAPWFRAPEDLLVALAAAGWDGCAAAGPNLTGGDDEGVIATIGAFGDADLGLAGVAATAAGRASPVLYDVGGIVVAHLSYLVAEPAEALDGSTVACFDGSGVLGDAAAARALGAEFVIVSLHWGPAGSSTPSAEQMAAARLVAEGGEVDLIVGVASGVVQHVERIGGTWVLFGLGNFVTSQSPSCCGSTAEDGVIFHLEIGDVGSGVEVTAMTMTPTWLDRTYMEVVPIANRLGDAGLPQWYRALAERAFDRTVVAIRGAGAEVALTAQRP